ncbi:MAG: VWA domain-containing protein [Planctomycetota bacterium]
MTDFRFAEPDRVLWLWAVVALAAVLVGLELRGSELLYRFMSPFMTQRLAARPSLARRILRVVYLTLAGVAVVLALMRPQWGVRYERLPQVGAQIMICLDVSRSMLAEDVAPNRLDRAKSEINDLLDLLDGDEVGLIAFAGKSTILSPMTTDFGFLKLILKEAGPQSAGRGGSRLEEPIRKAVAGFGEAADLSRVILLITDGDDLDSYPLAAAEEARAKGIRILTVGFGDESGSRIRVTDPNSGLKSMIRDASGEAVVSRLNGDLLREIAMVTEGAYIPAGTGSLDLVEIHNTHIAPLLRAETEGTLEQVENEGFQWALLAAMTFLLLSLAATRRPRRIDLAPELITPVAACLFGVGWFASMPPQLVAQDPMTSVAPGDATSDDAMNPAADEESDEESDEGLSPRERYNRGVVAMGGGPGDALEEFAQARADAGADGELRYRAAFNLGWLASQQSDELLEANPREALQRLRLGIDWYQRAVRLRPKSEDARYNLELLMRRAAALADALAEREQGDLARRLDQLIQAQRETMREAATVLATYAAADRLTLDSEDARRDFREIAVKERQRVADAEQVNELITSRLANAASPSPTGAGPGDPDMWEPAQLEAARGYLTTATQRLSKARSQFKLREGPRGYRRAHLGLEALKSARDQLREPGQRLQRLLGETQSLIQQTRLLAGAESSQVIVPVWLDTPLLEGTQTALLARTDEIAALLEVPDTTTAEAGGPLTAQELENARAAQQAMVRASDAFRDSADALRNDAADTALPSQQEALRHLNEAMERLIELRGLIELVYRDASGVAQAVRGWETLVAEVDAEALQRQLAQVHQRNVLRADRLQEKLENELQKAQAPAELSGPATPNSPAPPVLSPEQAEQAEEQQRLEQAVELMQRARQHMDALTQQLPEALVAEQPEAGEPAEEAAAEEAAPSDEPPAEDDAPTDEDSPTDTELSTDPTEEAAAVAATPLQVAQQEAAEMREQLAALRRLFYSIAEHLEETSQQQASVNDDTQALAGDPTRDVGPALGPIGARQEAIKARSAEIAQGLQELAQQAEAQQAEVQQADPAPSSVDSTTPQIEQYGKASALVREGVGLMSQLDETMQEVPPPLSTLRDQQDEALEKLLEALALLKSPQEQQNPENQQPQSSPQQQDEQQGDQEQDQQQAQQGMSAQQLLQMVRDREAQRRKDQQKKAAAGRPQVEKDW